jgi:hypothetical protein
VKIGPQRGSWYPPWPFHAPSESAEEEEEEEEETGKCISQWMVASIIE